MQSTGGLTEMDAVNPAGFLQTYKIEAYASQITAVTSKAVYSLAGTTGVPITRGNSPIKGYVGLDWFESGVSRADVVRDGRDGVRGRSVECNAASCQWGGMLAPWGEGGFVVHGSSSLCFGLGGAVCCTRAHGVS